ncbi:hydrolase [Acrocarpospora phusangensis]|uniref:Hydrolase n=1 Tax=Acrocarpospora phusangensis TaxID=1070424 RepID=A0A919UKV9_9ACTN|nr:alpha/beta fold hydrolase [Acrocarpospora phusangensis]GIH25471.1 hydrolase [Acrocarpospora phusangensis]
MELVYERRGSGPPLVLIHGIGHRWQAWAPVLDLLAERFDVIAVDLPGFGASPPLPPGMPYNAETLAYAVEACWERLGVRDPHVAGSSLGGYLALDMASRGVVRSATALAPTGFWSRSELFYARAMLRLLRAAAVASPPEMAGSRLGRAMLGRLLVWKPSRVPSEELVAGMGALRASVGFDDTLDSFLWQAPPAPPKVPITVAWGEHDRLLVRRQAVRAGRWAQQRVKLLKGCGHLPMSDDPELVTRVITDGARELSPTG